MQRGVLGRPGAAEGAAVGQTRTSAGSGGASTAAPTPRGPSPAAATPDSAWAPTGAPASVSTRYPAEGTNSPRGTHPLARGTHTHPKILGPVPPPGHLGPLGGWGSPQIPGSLGGVGGSQGPRGCMGGVGGIVTPPMPGCPPQTWTSAPWVLAAPRPASTPSAPSAAAAAPASPSSPTRGHVRVGHAHGSLATPLAPPTHPSPAHSPITAPPSLHRSFTLHLPRQVTPLVIGHASKPHSHAPTNPKAHPPGIYAPPTMSQPWPRPLSSSAPSP